MARALPEGWGDLIRKLHQGSEWLWLWELEADVSATARTVFRVVSYDQTVTVPNFQSALEFNLDESGSFGAERPMLRPVHKDYPVQFDVGSQEAGDAVFYPLPMRQSELQQGGEGDLPTMTLTLDNTARTLTRWFQKGDGFMGRKAAAYLVNLTDLQQRVVYTFRVKGATVSTTTAALLLEMPNFVARSVPEDRFDARRCRFRFAHFQCGYIINAAAAYTDCNKTLGDCIERGDDEVTRNLPRLHPRRFGGFPGVPTQ